MAHNIVTGRVTRRQDHTPFSFRKFAKRVAIVAGLIFAAMLALGFFLESRSDHATKPYPVCEVEDGSTQKLCVFHGSDGNDYVHHNYGEWWEVHPR